MSDTYDTSCLDCMFTFRSTDYNRANKAREGHSERRGHRTVVWVQDEIFSLPEGPSRAADALHSDMMDDDWL